MSYLDAGELIEHLLQRSLILIVIVCARPSDVDVSIALLWRCLVLLAEFGAQDGDLDAENNDDQNQNVDPMILSEALKAAAPLVFLDQNLALDRLEVVVILKRIFKIGDRLLIVASLLLKIAQILDVSKSCHRSIKDLVARVIA